MNHLAYKSSCMSMCRRHSVLAISLLHVQSLYVRAVDIWAVGCLITEMLTGDPLFPGDSDIDQLYHIIKCFGEFSTHFVSSRKRCSIVWFVLMLL